MAVPRKTLQVQLVLRALLESPQRAMYGLEICDAVGLQPGTIHPILARLEGVGWLESWFEDVDPRQAGRPQRRYYRLTPAGAGEARAALSQAVTKVDDLLRRHGGG